MLRALFGEPPRKDEGLLLEANQAIRNYLQVLSRIPGDRQTPHERRFVIWSENFLRALDELEQSEYAAILYGSRVNSDYVDQMQPGETHEYHRHLYYYRNALIRLFAILDKLGHFLNERFVLQTERVKSRFSYFTVLRNMHQNGLHTDLEQQLYELKIKYKEPVDRLRNKRNMEIHTINADLLDDLMKAEESRRGERLRPETEEIKANLDDLREGCEMAMKAVTTAFRYIARHPAATAAPKSAPTSRAGGRRAGR